MYHAEPMSAAAAEIAAALTAQPDPAPSCATPCGACEECRTGSADDRELDAVRRLLWIAANRSKHGALRFTDDELAAVPALPGMTAVPSPGGFTIVAHRDGDERAAP